MNTSGPTDDSSRSATGSQSREEEEPRSVWAAAFKSPFYQFADMLLSPAIKMWMWHQRRDIIWHPDACKCHPGYCWFYVSSAIHSDSLQFALCRSSQLCSASASVMKHVPGRAVCRKLHWRCCFVKLIRIWDAGRVWEVKSLELVQICTFFRKILRKSLQNREHSVTISSPRMETEKLLLMKLLVWTIQQDKEEK